jgi:hypothetical protein
MSSYPTQAGAELAAREVVMRDKAELLIHSHTGQIRDRPAYTRHDRATSPADRAELDPYRRWTRTDAPHPSHPPAGRPPSRPTPPRERQWRSPAPASVGDDGIQHGEGFLHQPRR